MKILDLVTYMQSLLGQLEMGKKRPVVYTYFYVLKSLTEFYRVKAPMSVDEVFTSCRLKMCMKQGGRRKMEDQKGGLNPHQF